MIRYMKLASMMMSILVCATAPAAEPPAAEKCLSDIAEGFDALLIDTAHVYVNPIDKVTSLYAADVGMVFMGKISMTATGGRIETMKRILGPNDEEFTINLDGMQIPMIIAGDRSKADLSKLSELSKLSKLSELAKLAEDPQLAKLGIDFKGLAELSELSALAEIGKPSGSTDEMKAEQEEVMKEAEDAKKEAGQALKEAEDAVAEAKAAAKEAGKDVNVIRIGKSAELKKEEAKRLEEMDTHIREFKTEIIGKMLEMAPKIKGLDAKERIIVAFEVKEGQFAEKYGTSRLVMQIAYKDLMRIKDQKADDPKTRGEFVSNL